MNSLNTDPNPNLNPNKFKSFDIQNQFYQYYRIPNSISPDFGSLQNPYGTNQLLATQFSFQYSDNQGLGDGINTNNHSNIWNAAPLNATLSSQSRNSQHQAIDPNSAHFFTIPPHAPGQATDQNLFYQYRYGAANNMFWTHPSMLEYKSGNQNYSLTTATAAVAPSSLHADKTHSWSEALINSQYAAQSLTNSINYKTALSPTDQSNPLQQQNILSLANGSNGSTNQSGYQHHANLGQHNGYSLSQHIDSNGTLECPVRGVAADNAHIGGVQRPSIGKSDNSLIQEKPFSVTSSSNNINAQVNILQSHLASDCSIHNDNGSNFDQSRSSNHNSSQQNYSPKSQTKHTSPNMDRSENSDFWNQDVSRTPSSSTSKSYAKVAKQPSRNTNCPNTISNQTSSAVFYANNGISGNSRTNYKSSMNGFATGYSRSMANNGTPNNWFNNSSAPNGNGWNATKSKWTQDNNRISQSSVPSDPNVKASWASKVTLGNADENIKSVEYQIKEFQSDINPKRLDLNFDKTRYFVIKSYSEDDVHRSIKYKIWCSTKVGNKRLNEAFQNAQKIGGHVLLFFSVNGSGHFCGIAEMTSCVDESVEAGVWCQDKWKGRFSVKWIYVKDVPNTQLRHISTKVQTPKSNECTEIKPITNLRDATELKSERTQGSSFKDDPGYQALRIIMDCKSSMSIFDDFLHYEKRERGIES